MTSAFSRIDAARAHPPRAGLDTIIQKLVRADFGGMRQCYEEGLGRDRKLSGRVATRFVITIDGGVSEAAKDQAAPA